MNEDVLAKWFGWLLGSSALVYVFAAGIRMLFYRDADGLRVRLLLPFALAGIVCTSIASIGGWATPLYGVAAILLIALHWSDSQIILPAPKRSQRKVGTLRVR